MSTISSHQLLGSDFFLIIFQILVNLHSNRGSFVPKLEVNLEINLGTFKFTISMFNYGQHVRIWIIEIDHRASLFLDSDLYSKLTKYNLTRTFIYCDDNLKMKRIFREVTKKLNGSSDEFHLIIVIQRSFDQTTQVTVLLVQSLCWWLYDVDWFQMLMAKSLCWRLFSLCNITYVADFLNVFNRSPTPWIGHQHLKLVTNTFGLNIHHQHRCNRRLIRIPSKELTGVIRRILVK